jgi:dephospho-CoA kinase
VIGLAGGIGSGKSTVGRILAELGCHVSDSDAAGRAALRDPRIKAQLLEWWGPELLDVQGEIDRGAVARIVFNDPQARRRLEALTHPWIESRRRRDWAAAPAGTLAFVIDAPLLFEAGLDAACDAVIFVEATPAVRLERVSRGRGWDAAELARRELSQMSLDAKRSRADHVIDNNGDLDSLTERVRQVLNDIVRTAQQDAASPHRRSSNPPERRDR